MVSGKAIRLLYMNLKILHIAPFNTSGVPITFVKSERKLGHVSRLITFGKDRRNYEEDICLNLPLLDFWGTRVAKRIVSHPGKLQVNNRLQVKRDAPLYWQPNGAFERALIRFREKIWQSKIEKLFREIGFWDFDVYQLDGGLEFFRDGHTVRRLHALGKKIICCYTGSDLRIRGVIQPIDAVSDLNVTLEFDHLSLHPNIHHVFFPFDVSSYPFRNEPDSKIIKIGHAPTNREAKGSDVIISAIESLQAEHPVELVLIENLSHKESLRLKSECHIFFDQIGDLGYGLNSLESLAMGIATCSSLPAGFEKKYPEHPFVAVDKSNIKAQLKTLVENQNLRQKLGRKGRSWVQRHHDGVQVVKKIHALARVQFDNSEELFNKTGVHIK